MAAGEALIALSLCLCPGTVTPGHRRFDLPNPTVIPSSERRRTSGIGYRPDKRRPGAARDRGRHARTGRRDRLETANEEIERGDTET